MGKKFKSYKEEYVYWDGVKDAFEVVKKVVIHPADGGLTVDELADIFDGEGSPQKILIKYDPFVICQKIEEYEKARYFKVGDIVENKSTCEKGVITCVDKNNIMVLMKNGFISLSGSLLHWKKTGETIPALMEEVLSNI